MDAAESEPGVESGTTTGSYRAWLASAWLAYGTLLLLQLKLLWGIWKFRDLTFGDTSGYFLRALWWVESWKVDMAWSPLYTAFYGCFVDMWRDAYVATTAHRVVIVLLLAALVLAVMRRLLPHPISWLMAAWWVVLPVHFNSVYEVHLFAVIPVLVAVLAASASPKPFARAAGLSILVLSTLLVRNELIVATILFTAACIAWESREPLRGKEGSTGKAYAIALGFAFLVTALFTSRAIVKLPELLTQNRPKHTVNMCQAYAFGFQQRHPEWKKSPWTDCSELMAADFGMSLPTLSEMVRANPGRVLTHFAWNLRLTPDGIQALLFNVIAGPDTPDYFPYRRYPKIAWTLSVLLAGLWLFGLVDVWRHPEGRPWRDLHARAGWLLLASVAATAFVIIPTQRPRPAYLFGLGLFVMALSGHFAHRLLEHAPAWKHRLERLAPIAMVVAILAAFYYRPSERPVLDLYRRLQPYAEEIARPETVLLVSRFGGEMRGYLGRPDRGPREALEYGVLDAAREGESFAVILDRRGIDIAYLDESLLDRLRTRPPDLAFLESPGRWGWKDLRPPRAGQERWRLLKRIDPRALP